MYGAIDLTETMDVKNEGQVCERLRPYLYTDKRGHINLNITIKGKRDQRMRFTHDMMASKKGVRDQYLMCELVEYQRPQEGTPTPEPRTYNNFPGNQHSTSESSNSMEGIDMPF